MNRMIFRPSERASPRPPGFTLLELLLTVVILMSALGALVLNFESLLRGKDLAEGVNRVSSLLRFVQAEAASTGRTLHLQFVRVEAARKMQPMYTVRVVYEPDPLARPGEYVEAAGMRWIQDGVNELVVIESVKKLGPSAALGLDPVDPYASVELGWGLQPLKFYPDGSSDSAEITILAREGSDGERRWMRLTGLTGGIIEVERPTPVPPRGMSTDGERV